MAHGLEVRVPFYWHEEFFLGSCSNQFMRGQRFQGMENKVS